MAVSADVMELVQILNEAGFEVLAGELLVEIGLGRDRQDDFVYDNETYEAKAFASVSLAYLGDRPPFRDAIPDSEQLGYAVRLLRLRLVEPIRRLAEAEQIAGLIGGASDPSAEIRKPIEIIFSPVADGDPPVLDRRALPGDRADADELARLLAQIATEVR